jgi:hypothetical protein
MELLQPNPDDAIAMYRVSTRVSSARNQGAELIGAIQGCREVETGVPQDADRRRRPDLRRSGEPADAKALLHDSFRPGLGQFTQQLALAPKFRGI